MTTKSEVRWLTRIHDTHVRVTGINGGLRAFVVARMLQRMADRGAIIAKGDFYELTEEGFKELVRKRRPRPRRIKS